MDISSAGVRLIARAGIVTVLIIVGALFRALVGPSRTRGEIMVIGTIGGMSSGVAVSNLVARWITTDVSAICACLGMMVGWAVAWLFARQVPRDAN
jgi:glycopeptide antibiotics resistance protein